MMDGIDMKALLAKAGEMQKQIAQKKAEAATRTVEISVGGGMVQLVMNGNLETLSVKIDPEIVERDEIETLEDLVRAAFNQGTKEAKQLVSDGLTDLATAMDLPFIQDLFKR
jgi:nucleoid-associated protein EbfC